MKYDSGNFPQSEFGSHTSIRIFDHVSNCHTSLMGLLTIIRKNRRREKEMRVLFL